MQSFGYAYDEDFNKYVAAFTWDLFKLTPEHQQMWKNKETTGETKLHPDYYLSQVLGQWPERISIYEAFVQELQVINQMATAMGRPPFFREDFGTNSRPAEFSSLLRPTAKEYNGFVHLLNKMLSDNINKDFFQKEVPSEDEVTRKDGNIQVQPRGTLRMLEQWIRGRFKPREDPAPMDKMFKSAMATKCGSSHRIDAIVAGLTEIDDGEGSRLVSRWNGHFPSVAEGNARLATDRAVIPHRQRPKLLFVIQIEEPKFPIAFPDPEILRDAKIAVTTHYRHKHPVGPLVLRLRHAVSTKGTQRRQHAKQRLTQRSKPHNFLLGNKPPRPHVQCQGNAQSDSGEYPPLVLADIPQMNP